MAFQRRVHAGIASVDLDARYPVAPNQVVPEQPRPYLDEIVRETADDVLECLADLFVQQGPPDYIRSDNGAEFTAKAVRSWLGRIGVKTWIYKGDILPENIEREAAIELEPEEEEVVETAPVAEEPAHTAISVEQQEAVERETAGGSD